MTFIEYYIEQWKDIPCLWKTAKQDKKMWAFLLAISLLFFPMAIFVMYLYDTGKMGIDSRYSTSEPIQVRSVTIYLNRRKEKY